MSDPTWVTPEDRALVRQRTRDAQRPPKSETPKRDRARSISAAIRYDAHLRPWMFAYAEWLMTELKPPTRAARLAKAHELARVGLSSAALYHLEAREDFLTYVTELQRGPIEAARAKFMNRLPSYIDGHWDAFEKATEANDYKAVAQITESAIDRVMPKRDTQLAATQINITLQPRQQELLADLDATVEVLEADVLAVEQHDSLG